MFQKVWITTSLKNSIQRRIDLSRLYLKNRILEKIRSQGSQGHKNHWRLLTAEIKAKWKALDILASQISVIYRVLRRRIWRQPSYRLIINFLEGHFKNTTS